MPLGGDLYLYDLGLPPEQAVRQLTDTPADETDARFSPRGGFVSFVRGQDLHVIDLATGRERAVTTGGGGAISHGVAEFIAQEEMDRDTGYWWAPDDSRIAWTRVDETPVAETERFEIDATTIRIVRQRYPFTGAANASVRLFAQDVAATTAPVEIDLALGDGYLPRVQFFPDGRRLAVQRQTRDQRRLELLEADATTGRTRVLLAEASDDWVPLHDELTFLPTRRQFLWASDRSGYRHLYLYGEDGRLVRQLTSGEHMTVGDRGSPAIKAVDEKRGLLWYASAAVSPVERHLYRLPLDGSAAPVQVTQGAGWHSVRMADHGRVYLDTWSTADQPPSVTLHAGDGRALQTLVDNRVVPGHPYQPYLDAHAPTEFGTLAAADGQVLHYQLNRPRQLEPGRRYPVVVNVYGGPGVQEVTNAWGGLWSLYSQYLVSRGYVVFQIDNRGSGQRGRRFEAASFHRLGNVEVDDQVRGVGFLRTLPYVDPARIGIFGWSYGGYMALLSVIKAPEAFAAAVAGAPVTDWKLYDTHYTERYLGTPASNPAGYLAANVLEQAAKLQRPLLLVHGMADDNVLFTHSTALMKRLQDAGRPFELMTYPGGKHGLVRHQDQGPHAFEAITRFFDRALAPPPGTR